MRFLVRLPILTAFVLSANWLTAAPQNTTNSKPSASAMMMPVVAPLFIDD